MLLIRSAVPQAGVVLEHEDRVVDHRVNAGDLLENSQQHADGQHRPVALGEYLPHAETKGKSLEEM